VCLKNKAGCIAQQNMNKANALRRKGKNIHICIIYVFMYIEEEQIPIAKKRRGAAMLGFTSLKTNHNENSHSLSLVYILHIILSISQCITIGLYTK